MFTITAVKATKPPTYTIEDTLGESVQGTFYEKSFSRVCKESTVSSECSRGQNTECLSSGNE